MDFVKLLSEFGGVIAIVVVGLFAFFAAFDKSKKNKTEEVNKADDRLVGLLQGTVDQLTIRLQSAEVTIKENQTELVTMKAENLLMKNIFQGRDEQTLRFQAEGFAAMKQMPALLETVTATNKNVERLYTLMEGYLEHMANSTIQTTETKTKQTTLSPA